VARQTVDVAQKGFGVAGKTFSGAEKGLLVAWKVGEMELHVAISG